MSGDPIRGKTLRFTFEDGPMAGKTIEHTFSQDGTVSWRGVDGNNQGGSESLADSGARYEHARINDRVYAVSYLGKSGYALTTILDLEAGTIVSFASNEKELVLQRGTFEPARAGRPG
jgi:hypothetical protein